MECKKIKMLDAGPNNNRTPGEYIIVDHVRATILVANGYAEYEAEVKKDVSKLDNSPGKRTSKPRAGKKSSKS